jgi:hypothetical protein
MAFNESVGQVTGLLEELQKQLDHWRAVVQTSGGLTWEQQMSEQQEVGSRLVGVAVATVEAMVEAYRDLMRTQEVVVDLRSRVEALEAQRR